MFYNDFKDDSYQLGDRFKRRLPGFLGRISDMHDLFQAEDREFDVINHTLEQFILSSFIDLIEHLDDPDPALRRLEKEYKLPHDGSIKKRVLRILAKKKAREPTTVQAVLRTCELFDFYHTDFIKHYERYCFELILKNNTAYTREFIHALEEIKPAHLNIEFQQLIKDILNLADTTRPFLTPFYMVGTNRHKTGQIFRHQYTGAVRRKTLAVKDGSRTPSQRTYKTKEPRVGQVYKNHKRGKGGSD